MTGPRMIAEALGDEDGETYSAEGHVPAAEMVLAVLVMEASCVDDGAALDLLTGAPAGARPIDSNGARREVARLIDAVRHVWAVPDPDNDDRMLFAGAGPETVGAEPFTLLDVR